MTTKTKEKDGFAAACEKEGVEGRSYAPFLPFKDKVGSWFLGTITGQRDVKYTPKRGKNKGKVQETVYFTVVVSESNIEGVAAGDEYTISPTGLLLYQLTEGRPKGLSWPCKVGVKYEGRDEEDRHQTTVAWPEAKQN